MELATENAARARATREPLRCLPLERRKIDAPNYGTPELRTFRMLTGLALMLRIVGLGLGEIGVRVLQEVGLRLLATEAVGLAFEAAVDRTIGLDVLVQGQAKRPSSDWVPA